MRGLSSNWQSCRDTSTSTHRRVRQTLRISPVTGVPLSTTWRYERRFRPLVDTGSIGSRRFDPHLVPYIELSGQRLQLQEVWDITRTGKPYVEYLHSHFDALVELGKAIDRVPGPSDHHLLQ